ncbi:MAG: DUF1211 domain-containing protein [Proteobacteria bacterium]|nr:DUF1211 domain-containing protein [Pseudomonadota bacterium]
MLASLLGDPMNEKADTGDRNITPHETIDERLLNRVIFFTDAVFAIVLTLMVLELKPPVFTDAVSERAAWELLFSQLFAMVMTFIVSGVFWIAHLSTTRRLRHFDWPTAVANLIFMFPICLLPFCTAWWGRDLRSGQSWGVYCIVMVLCSAANLGLVVTAARGGGRLMGGITRREWWYRVLRAASPGVAFGLGLVLLGLNQITLAQWSWLLIPIQLAVYGRTVKPTAAKP